MENSTKIHLKFQTITKKLLKWLKLRQKIINKSSTFDILKIQKDLKGMKFYEHILNKFF